MTTAFEALRRSLDVDFDTLNVAIIGAKAIEADSEGEPPFNVVDGLTGSYGERASGYYHPSEGVAIDGDVYASRTSTDGWMEYLVTVAHEFGHGYDDFRGEFPDNLDEPGVRKPYEARTESRAQTAAKIIDFIGVDELAELEPCASASHPRTGFRLYRDSNQGSGGPSDLMIEGAYAIPKRVESVARSAYNFFVADPLKNYMGWTVSANSDPDTMNWFENVTKTMYGELKKMEKERLKKSEAGNESGKKSA